MNTEPLLFSSSELLEILSLSENATAIYTTGNIIIQTASDAMLGFWGQDRSAIGLPLEEAVPVLKGQPFIGILQNVWRTGISYTAKNTPAQLQVNGQLQTLYFDFSYRALKNKNGETYCILHTATDVTLARQKMTATERQMVELNAELSISNRELTNSETCLRENEQRLQSILDTMAEGVGIIDHTGQLIYANSMAQQILGLEESEIKKRTYHDPKWQNLRIDGTPLPESEHPMTIMMTTGKPVYDCEIGVQPTNGERFYISINAAPLFDNEGKLTGGIGTFMDVTSRRKMIQHKDDFISIASHELKTPVTSLKASLQLLDAMKTNPNLVFLPRLVDQCNRSIDKIAKLIEELLDVSRLTQGHLQLKKTTFNVSEMLAGCCNHVRMAGKHDLILQGDRELQIYADEHRIDQVVVNLVNNAVKYAASSTEIYLIVEKLNGMAKVSVKDSGPGIALEKTLHLFDRYYQAEEGGGSKPGLGLGLFISSEIIKNHGGEIGVQTEPGKGSTFWFTLPL